MAGKSKVAKSKKGPGGRPTKYKEEYAEQAYKFCLLGADDEKLAKLFEVDVRTINRWKKDQPEFRQSITNGKDVADAEVAKSLYKRALGYTYEETKVSESPGSDGDSRQYVTTTTKEVAPDTAAAFIWLKNRQSKKWRDKREEHKTEEKTVTINVVDDFVSRISGIAARRGEAEGNKKLN
jgi:hypothetical protein